MNNSSARHGSSSFTPSWPAGAWLPAPRPSSRHSATPGRAVCCVTPSESASRSPLRPRPCSVTWAGSASCPARRVSPVRLRPRASEHLAAHSAVPAVLTHPDLSARDPAVLTGWAVAPWGRRSGGQWAGQETGLRPVDGARAQGARQAQGLRWESRRGPGRLSGGGGQCLSHGCRRKTCRGDDNDNGSGRDGRMAHDDMKWAARRPAPPPVPRCI